LLCVGGGGGRGCCSLDVGVGGSGALYVFLSDDGGKRVGAMSKSRIIKL